MRQLWTSVLKRADNYKEQVGRQVDRLKEFQHRIGDLMDWMNNIETHSGFTVPSSTSIQQMKVHFEHVKVCELFQRIKKKNIYGWHYCPWFVHLFSFEGMGRSKILVILFSATNPPPPKPPAFLFPNLEISCHLSRCCALKLLAHGWESSFSRCCTV